MKFAKSLQRNQVPEWSRAYLDYKALKKIIKELNHQRNGQPVAEGSLVPFYYALDRNIEHVDSFYNRKFTEYSRQLKHVSERMSLYKSTQVVAEDELEDLVDVLLSLRAQFRKLQWYAEVNKRGFVKILKKLDKKLQVQLQTKLLASKVFVLPFANGTLLDADLAKVNDYLGVVAPYTQEVDSNGSNNNGHLIDTNPMDVAPTTDQIMGRSFETRRLSNTSTASYSDSTTVSEMKNAVVNDDIESLARACSSLPQKALLSGLAKAISCKSKNAIVYLLDHLDSLDGPAELNGRNVIHRYIINHGRHSRELQAAKAAATTTTNNSSTNGSAATGSTALSGNSSNVSFNTSPTSNTPSANGVSSSASSLVDVPTKPPVYGKNAQYINPAELPTKLSVTLGSDGVNAQDENEILTFLFDHFHARHRSALITKDQYDRTPLHYAAHYGLKLITRVVIEYMNKWELDKTFSPSDWQDSEGTNPLQLAIAGNHPITTKEILSGNPRCAIDMIEQSAGLMLHVAARLGSDSLLKVLLDFEGHFDVNKVDDDNETPLFVATKLNQIEAVKFLISRKADMEIAESTYGWTPLIVAAVDGYLDVAKVLLGAGANTSYTDDSGWTAMEHACLRGHLSLANILTPKELPWSTVDDLKSPILGPVDEPLSLNSSTHSLISNNTVTTTGSNGASAGSSNNKFHGATSVKSGKFLKAGGPSEDDNLREEAVLTFGHRCLDRTMLLVTLGSTDLRKASNPVSLDRVPYAKAHSTKLDTALSLVLSSTATGEEMVYDLPIPDDGHATEPVSFYLEKESDLQDTKLYFDLVPTYSGNRKKMIGRAVALLGSIFQTFSGGKVGALNKTLTLPIVESETLEVLGTVRFELLLITPFNHPNMQVQQSSRTYWKSLITTRVIGHRGLGKNSTSKRSLQLGENTLESFIQAANLGASYVEFDVQLTKDHEPVIYHDFLVGETGIDIPMHELTLEQFLDISKPKRTPKLKPHSPMLKPVSQRLSSSPETRPRSMSVYSDGEKDEYDVMSEQMRFTRDFKTKGFKGNFRGHSIQSPFTTLEEVFKTIPKNVGFNIECKYPMLDESENEDMQAVAIELNTWIDRVLKCVYDFADGRDIIFSSFHPDICIMLSLKQPSIPVLFLTEGGTQVMRDVRASSLQEAIRFAKRWNLLGIVSECTPLIMCPRLVNVVKESGLVCVTYGSQNNDPVKSRLQMKSGVDAVIVDSVLAVRKGLTNGVTESEVKNSAIASTIVGTETKASGTEPRTSTSPLSGTDSEIDPLSPA